MRMSWVWLFRLRTLLEIFHEDLNNDRCYIPSEKFEKFGLKKEFDKIVSNPEKIQEILQEMLMNVDSHFKKSDYLLKSLDKKK